MEAPSQVTAAPAFSAASVVLRPADARVKRTYISASEISLRGDCGAEPRVHYSEPEATPTALARRARLLFSPNTPSFSCNEQLNGHPLDRLSVAAQPRDKRTTADLARESARRVTP
ncbi:hypothetical protein V5799_010308 [Amblyomma americanum]|uniref:Uncharacterized protein n=1 Tax=Amblyomma americanum TaxID=6943 RepID=A0AAQ4F909_AMBAM